MPYSVTSEEVCTALDWYRPCTRIRWLPRWKYLQHKISARDCRLVQITSREANKYTNSDWRQGHHWKLFYPKFVKCCPRLKIKGNILRTKGNKFQWWWTLQSLFCYIPQIRTIQQVNCDDFMLPEQQCAGNSAYLLTTRDAILINRLQIF